MRKTHIWCVNYTEIVYKIEKMNQRETPGGMTSSPVFC